MTAGYYLLDHVGKEESKVHMLFLIKDAPEEIGAYSKRVGKVADDTVSIILHFQDTNASLQWDQDPLPKIEVDVRASIRDDKMQQLVYDTSGTEFIRAFLVTQVEASTYALNLAKVLADKETDPRRASALLHLSGEWLKMRNEAFRLLRRY